MQAIRQLDQDHAYVLRHRQQNFLCVLGLFLDLVLELDVRHLADAIDQHRDIIAELARDQLAGGRGIFQYVMQDTGDDAFYIHVHLGKNPCHGNRVVNVGFARYPYLAFVRLGAEQVGIVYLFDLVIVHVAGDQVAQV